MGGFARYAIYWAPEPGPLADWAAGWLGWDPVGGTEPSHPDLPGLPRPVTEITATPRKYGFHGTVKPPFRLADGLDAAELDQTARALCADLAPVALPGLALHRIGGFVALTPEGDQTALAGLAARVVGALDRFRLPPDAAEIARRRPERLSERQREHLARWGYPYVMDEFRFHLTLSGDLPAAEAEALVSALAPAVAPLLPRPFSVDSLCLFGQADDGRFRLIERYALTG
ncbi:DUF1045 domain-containing protein [Tabrizicola sp. J26]|nr:DUF1045 domain-containing protein [Tabrizicola rongguiensis]MCF1708674.1 DUF1045 domain-containing protein [Tabrizicola rongguiensis]